MNSRDLAPLRILQVIETGGPGGAETVFARLSGALAARGHHVHCLIRQGSWLPAELERRGLPASFFESRGAFDVALIRSIRALIRAHDIQLVHGHLFDGAMYAALAARSLGVPALVTLHGQVDVRRSGWRMQVKRSLFRHAVARVALVSHALQRDLAGSLGVPERRQMVVHNGVPVPEVGGPGHHRTWSGAGAPEVRILAIGNIRSPKNYPMLLEAFALVLKVIPQAQLDIAGEPDRSGEIQRALADTCIRLGIDAHVTFHGFVADPAPLLHNADAFVLASTQEGFSLATIEAMLADVPVVSTRSGGPEEIVTDGETGRLVPVNDPVALAGALITVLTDRVGSSAMASRAKADAIHRFSLERMVESYIREYRSLIPTGR